MVVLCVVYAGLCQRQHKNLLIAVQQAWDLGRQSSYLSYIHAYTVSQKK